MEVFRINNGGGEEATLSASAFTLALPQHSTFCKLPLAFLPPLVILLSIRGLKVFVLQWQLYLRTIYFAQRAARETCEAAVGTAAASLFCILFRRRTYCNVLISTVHSHQSPRKIFCSWVRTSSHVLATCYIYGHNHGMASDFRPVRAAVIHFWVPSFKLFPLRLHVQLACCVQPRLQVAT